VSFVVMRGVSSTPMRSIGVGAPPICKDPVDAGATGVSSANEFHALQSGQRPSHLFDCPPHSVHEKTIAAFLAIDERL
jgi:hypothetical protein